MTHIPEDVMSLIHQRDFLVKENERLRKENEELKADTQLIERNRRKWSHR